MSVRKLGAQLFGFAVLLAALFVLPQVAQAHPGHVHVMHVHTGDPADAAAQTADASDVDHDASTVRTGQSLSAASESTPGQDHDTPCSDRDCCTQSSCAACFSIVAPLPPQVAPPSLSIAISPAANPQPPGIAASSLRRPPKSFA